MEAFDHGTARRAAEGVSAASARPGLLPRAEVDPRVPEAGELRRDRDHGGRLPRIRRFRDTPRIIGIDPSPNVRPVIAQQPPAANAQIYELTSDEFFDRYDLTDLFGGPVVLAFIDGLHLFEQVLARLRQPGEAFRRPHAHPPARLHPIQRGDGEPRADDRFLLRRRLEGSARAPAAAAGAEDGHRSHRADRALPGHGAGRRATGSSRRSCRRSSGSYRDLDFDYYLGHRDEMPEEIPHQGEGGRGLAAGRPAGS